MSKITAKDFPGNIFVAKNEWGEWAVSNTLREIYSNIDEDKETLLVAVYKLEYLSNLGVEYKLTEYKENK